MTTSTPSERYECNGCSQMFRFNPDLVPRFRDGTAQCANCLHVENEKRARSHMEPKEAPEGAYLPDTLQDQIDDQVDEGEYL